LEDSYVCFTVLLTPVLLIKKDFEADGKKQLETSVEIKIKEYLSLNSQLIACSCDSSMMVLATSKKFTVFKTLSKAESPYEISCSVGVGEGYSSFKCMRHFS
jgi:hypothetical protein